MKSNLVLIGVLSLLIAGCGTVNTVVRGDTVTRRNLKEISYCKTIPRVYSGVSYDLCALYGPPGPGYSWAGGNSAVALITDLVFCGILDTVVLPYTIYRQSRDGSIYIQ